MVTLPKNSPTRWNGHPGLTTASLPVQDAQGVIRPTKRDETATAGPGAVSAVRGPPAVDKPVRCCARSEGEVGAYCHPKLQLDKSNRVAAIPVVQSVNRMSAYSSAPPPSETIVVRRAATRLEPCNQQRPVTMQSKGSGCVGTPDPGGSIFLEVEMSGQSRMSSGLQ